MNNNTGRQNISIILPCYNEEKNIARQISYANSTLNKITDDYEIIIVNDGSTDGSRVLLEQLAKDNDKIKVISHKSNLAYGKALKSGFKQATKDLVFFTSMDNQYDINQINTFLQYIVHNDIVIGYRAKRKDPFYRIFIAKSYNLLIRILYGLEIQDIDCAFKLFRKNVISRLQIKSQYSFIDAEILLKAKKSGYSIKQLEVQHYPRMLGSSTVGFKAIVLTLIETIKFYRELHLLGGNQLDEKKR